MKYTLKENGLYKLEYTEEDLLEIASQYHNVVEISNIKVYEYDNNFIMFETYRSTNFDPFIIEEDMQSDDIVYFDSYTDMHYNFSNNHIVWLKVDNLKENEEEFLSVPLSLKEIDIHYGLALEKHLYDIAYFTIYSFMEIDVFIHAMFNSYYNEDEYGDKRYNKIDIDNHFNNLMWSLNESYDE